MPRLAAPARPRQARPGRACPASPRLAGPGQAWPRRALPASPSLAVPGPAMPRHAAPRLRLQTVPDYLHHTSSNKPNPRPAESFESGLPSPIPTCNPTREIKLATSESVSIPAS